MQQHQRRFAIGVDAEAVKLGGNSFTRHIRAELAAQLGCTLSHLMVAWIAEQLHQPSLEPRLVSPHPGRVHPEALGEYALRLRPRRPYPSRQHHPVALIELPK